MSDRSALETSRRIATRLLDATGAALAFESWTGERWGPDDAAATVVLHHPGALRALFLPPNDLTAAEAYIYDDIDLRGDIVPAMEAAAHLQAGMPWHRRLALLRALRTLPDEARRREAERPRLRGRLHSMRRDRRAVTHHYDVGNDFFALFLGETLTYSCADFLAPDEALDTAQLRKIDLICRKLSLQPGDRFLDVGCGWGSLVIHAAAEYGVEAVGITLSRPQAELARKRAAEAGVAGNVDIRELDYREISGTFDAIASVGMVEHVGRKKLATYFGHLRTLLAPGGALLNHGITTRDRSRSRRRPTFVYTYVFPDGELVPIEDVVEEAGRAGFELRDLESLRTSYALTLRRWVANLESRRDRAIELSGERLYRIWRLYMAGSVVAFDSAGLSVSQLLLTDPARPWRFGRSHLLAADDDGRRSSGTTRPSPISS